MDPQTMAMLAQFFQSQGGQGGQGGQSGFGGHPGALGGLDQFLNGIFGRSGSPYQKGMNEYQNYSQQGIDVQKPFYEAGKGAIPQYQEWLKSQQDPSKFINNLMGGYQASPYSQYLQQQSMRAGQNAASASGMTGSTPFAQQLQQNASNIAGQDMQDWLGRVLGVNTQYGQGLNNLMGYGQHAGDIMSEMYGNAADWMGQAAYGREQGRQRDRSNIINGGFDLLFG